MSELEWHESSLIGSGAKTYRAFTQRGRYDILAMKPDSRGPSWATSRMDHPLMPKFDGYCPSLEEAKQACERDFVALARADRWLDFIRDNEPPTENW